MKKCIGKLKIPLFLFVMGVTSGLYQMFPNLFLVNTSYFIRNVVFIGLIGIIFTIESTKVNEKKVHIIIGILLICSGIIFDNLMV